MAEYRQIEIRNSHKDNNATPGMAFIAIKDSHIYTLD